MRIRMIGAAVSAAGLAVLLAADARSQPPTVAPFSLEPGDLLVSDAANGRIHRVRPSTGAVDLAVSRDDFALLRSPGELVQAPDGIVYVADRVNGHLLRIDPAAGTAGPLITPVMGCQLAQFLDLGSPWGLAVDHNGALFAASRNGSLFRVTPSTECAGLWRADVVTQNGALLEARSLAVTSDDGGDGDFAFLAGGGPVGVARIDLATGQLVLLSDIPTRLGGEVFGLDVLGSCAGADCFVPFTQNVFGNGTSCSAAGLFRYRRIGVATIVGTLTEIFPDYCLFHTVANTLDEVFITFASTREGRFAKVARMFPLGAGEPWDGFVVAHLPDGPADLLPGGMTRVTVAVPEVTALPAALAALAALLGLALRGHGRDAISPSLGRAGRQVQHGSGADAALVLEDVGENVLAGVPVRRRRGVEAAGSGVLGHRQPGAVAGAEHGPERDWARRAGPASPAVVGGGAAGDVALSVGRRAGPCGGNVSPTPIS